MIDVNVLDYGTGAATTSVVTATISPKKRTQLFGLFIAVKSTVPASPPAGSPSNVNCVAGCGLDWDMSSAVLSSVGNQSARATRAYSDMGWFGNQVEDTPTTDEITWTLTHANYDHYAYMIVECAGSYSVVGPNGRTGSGGGDNDDFYSLDPFARPEHGLIGLVINYDTTEANSAAITFNGALTTVDERFTGVNNSAGITVGFLDTYQSTFGWQWDTAPDSTPSQYFDTVWELAVSNYPKTVTVG